MNNGAVILEENYAIPLNCKSYTVIKRIFDITISLIGIFITMLILIFVKIIFILKGDKEKIIFKQKRIGLNGKEFNLYKIRTMIPNAEEYLLNTLLKENPKIREEYLKNKKIENDPRITCVGKILRKLSLDEFPQFINVFKGEMSIIGPRPYLPYEKADMKDCYNDIISVKPGITGPWQVSGRNDISFEKRILIDQEYSKNKSLKTDIKIFFKTFTSVLCKKGAK